MGQFSGLLNELESTGKKSPKTTNKATKRSPEKANPVISKQSPKASKTTTVEAIETAPARMRGKRSDPAYTQAPAFIRKDTYKAVKIALLNDERKLDYSDLVEELLTAWLKR